MGRVRDKLSQVNFSIASHKTIQGCSETIIKLVNSWIAIGPEEKAIKNSINTNLALLKKELQSGVIIQKR